MSLREAQVLSVCLCTVFKCLRLYTNLILVMMIFANLDIIAKNIKYMRDLDLGMMDHTQCF